MPPLDPPSVAVIRAIYADAEAEMLRRIAKRIAQGIDSPTWEAARLADLLRVRADLESQIVQATRNAGSMLDAAIAEGYRREATAALSEIESAGGRITASLGRGGNRPAVRALAQEASGVLGRMQPRILRGALDVYRSTVIEAAGTVLTGARTRRAASQAILDRFAMRGVSGFVDAAGRQWDMASYAEMTARTAVANASREGHRRTLIDEGFDLAIISTSPARCPLCDPWEGRVVSLSGNSDEYPSIDEARSSGLFHANCTHRSGLYVPGLTNPAPDRPPKRERDRLFEESQTQRYNERQIRAWKRREAVALSPQAQADARAKVRAWQGAQRAHVQRTGRMRKYEREQIERAR